MIKLKNISKSFGDVNVLDNVSYEIEEGKITSILGPSGVGKTTLLNIMSGILKADSGEIHVPDNSNISYLFQEDRLMPWFNVYKNIEYVLKDKEDNQAKINQYLELVEMSKWKNSYPSELSGGMKRRVAIARSLVFPCNILLMDEPFNGLDKDLINRIVEKLLVIWKNENKTVVIVTHEPKLLDICDNNIYLNKRQNNSEKIV